MESKKNPDYSDDFVEDHVRDRYEILDKMGSGAYGHVWKIRHKASGKMFALKKIFLAFQNKIDAKRTFREISILKKLDHPNIVKLKEVIKAQNDLDLYLIFDFV